MFLLPLVSPLYVNVQRSSQDYSSAWKTITARIRSLYYARVTNKTQMENLLSKYTSVAEAATNDQEFEKAIDDMIAEFSDSHFEIYTPADQGYYLFDNMLKGSKTIPMPNIGAWFKHAGDGYTVQMVLNDTPASQNDIRIGDKLVSVDDKPFEPIDSFVEKAGKPVDLKIERNGVQLDKKLIARSGPALGMFLEASRNSSTVLDDGGKKIGYFHLWTQANDDFKNLLSAEVGGKLAKTDGFVLDLRAGFGGRPEGFADPFFRPDYDIRWTYANNSSVEHFGYSKPLVVLIDGGSRSAKELLSYLLKKSGRAILIGQTTAGNVLGTSPIRINDWCILEIPIVDVSVNGRRLEKNGVQPNIKVDPMYGPNGEDLALKEALAYFKRH